MEFGSRRDGSVLRVDYDGKAAPSRRTPQGAGRKVRLKQDAGEALTPEGVSYRVGDDRGNEMKGGAGQMRNPALYLAVLIRIGLGIWFWRVVTFGFFFGGISGLPLE
jgi:hypothetical protein